MAANLHPLVVVVAFVLALIVVILFCVYSSFLVGSYAYYTPQPSTQVEMVYGYHDHRLGLSWEV